ncbi:DUF1177 family protein [Variovorax sp. J22R133]|uniref:DUF1177 family protein n=1 Tax=Variovorax brevis TaxID=3053503 RepID=UPI002578A6F4|nr:DUF1177 family protein [Variovorax sp. J22R133]MDM0117592.1 DUF1177 family protein [Variovorax sp. J22R133]
MQHHRSHAFRPSVKEGYILPVARDLLRIMEKTSGREAIAFPIATHNITPCDDGLRHMNTIKQPSVATSAATVGASPMH